MFSSLQMIALEYLCYVLGAGAFSVFIRWLQNTAGTTEDGMYNATVWNILVPLVILVSFCILFGMSKKLIKKRLYLDESTENSLKNDGKLNQILRILIGLIMVAGSGLLFVSCETEKNALLLRVLAAFGFLSGAVFPWLMRAFNRPETNRNLMCTAASLPVMMFGVWLIATYKANDINGIVWAYGVEIVCICFALFAFFRAAGFAYESLNLKKFLNATSRGIFMLVVALGDERPTGQQIMLVGAICMLLYYDWVVISNLKQREAPISYQPRDGFDYL